MINRKTWLMLAVTALLALGARLTVIAGGLSDIKTVFVVMMENHDWSAILDTNYCPYVVNSLLPRSSFCTQYYNPPALHPSLPNYLWLEAGTNFGITSDNVPSAFPAITTTNHLVTLLKNAGVSWKSYQEGIPGNTCPVTDGAPGDYVTRHDPFVYFTDVTSNFAYCTNHIRPYSELEGDLQRDNLARYNFITPALTNDMHDTCCGITSRRILGNHWLSLEIPKILNSKAWSNNGALFIIWDEGSNDTSDGPIGCMVISPLAKGHAYSNAVHYTHSSTVRTMQDIFGVQPYIRSAATAVSLSDLFVNMAVTSMRVLNGNFSFTITGTIPGRTNVIEASSDFIAWQPIRTNIAAATVMSYTDGRGTQFGQMFYRVRLVP